MGEIMEALRPLDTLENVRENTKALKIVGTAYAGRSGVLTAVLQYVYQTVALAGAGQTEAAKAFEQLASVKLYDLELMGTLIRRLGASPVYTACPPYPVSHYSASCVDYSKSLSRMLAADLALEETAEENLARIRATVDDASVLGVLDKIAEDGAYCKRRLEELGAGVNAFPA